MSTWRVATVAAALLVLAPGLAAQEEGRPERPREMRGMMEMHEMMEMHGMRGSMHRMMHGRMQRGRTGGAMMGRMGMVAGAPGPMMLLRAREALELTDAQVERLEGLQAEIHEASQARMEQARAAQDRVREALGAETPDPQAVESALEEASAHRIQAHMTMLRGHLQAREVLTAEQRARLQETMEMMRSLRPERPARPRGMRDGMPMRRPRGERPPPPPSF